MKQLKYYSKWFNPTYRTSGAAGVDLSVNTWADMEAYDQNNIPRTIERNEHVLIPAGWRVKIGTGFFTELPAGAKSLVALRSSAGWKKGLIMPNAPALIDADYRGEWFIVLYNPLSVPISIQHGERIAQTVFDERYEWLAVNSPTDLEATERGEGGFGSTGK